MLGNHIYNPLGSPFCQIREPHRARSRPPCGEFPTVRSVDLGLPRNKAVLGYRTMGKSPHRAFFTARWVSHYAVEEPPQVERIAKRQESSYMEGSQSYSAINTMVGIRATIKGPWNCIQGPLYDLWLMEYYSSASGS